MESGISCRILLARSTAIKLTRRTLDATLKNQTHRCKAEKKKVGLDFEYRIFQVG